jgi:hypothetical protein
MGDDYGVIKIGRRYYRMTGRGYLLVMLLSNLLWGGLIWAALTLLIIGLSPLYG